MQFTYFNRSLETAPTELLEERQILRLKYLMREVLKSNPFYRAKLHAEGFQSAEDLSGPDAFMRLPLTTKAELVRDQDWHPPFGTNLTFAWDRYVRLHQTSGTTGRPLRWLDTKRSWLWWSRCWATVFQAAGVGAGDRIHFPFSFGPFIGFWAAWAGAREVDALAISGGGQSSEQRLRNIFELEATVVCCTPSYALHLAEVASSLRLDLHATRVRALIVAGEPGGSIPATRERIENAWGARVYDHTGATEVGAFGLTCQASSGVHLNQSEFVFEVLSPETGEPTDEGELVITNLGRVGSPVIRYRTGDLVKLVRLPCECGRTFPRMLGGILGRADDMLTVRGINIFPSAVENLVRGHPEVTEFSCDVYRRGELDEMELGVETNGESSGNLPEQLARELRAALGLRVEIVCKPAGTLPRYELKARRFHDRRPQTRE